MALLVQCLWHKQICSSAVTSLAISPIDGAVFCGCKDAKDSKNPIIQSALLVLDPKDGQLSRSLSLPGARDVCSLWFYPSSALLFCCRADGTLSLFDGTTAATTPESPLPSMAYTLEEAPAPALAAGKRPNKLVNSESPAASHASFAPSTPAAQTSAEFIRSLRYRGPKAGYLYREGSLGNGYYRESVVIKYLESDKNNSGEDSSSKDERISGPPGAPAGKNTAQQGKGIRCCIVFPSLEWVATAGEDSNNGNVTVWRLPPNTTKAEGAGPLEQHRQASLPLTATLQGHTSGVLSLAVSPKGSLLFTGSYDQTIRVWDTATWSCIKVLRGHGGGVKALAVSADGYLLYSAAADNTARVWSTGTWVCLRLMQGRHEDTTWPACMALHPQPKMKEPREEASPETASSSNASSTTTMYNHKGIGAALVTGSTGPFGSSTLKAFDPGTGVCLSTFAQLGYDQRGGITAVAFSPNGEILFSGASDGSVAAWEMKWGNEGEDRSSGKKELRKGFFL